MDKEVISIKKVDGSVEKAEIVTYLKSDDGLQKYIVYTKGEKQAGGDDQVIYISKFDMQENVFKLKEISDNDEWNNVQHLLKKIANV